MSYFDRITGKPLDRLSDALPGMLNETCDQHPGRRLISRCGQCGAPICCPICCDEALAECAAPIQDSDDKEDQSHD